MSTIDSLEYTTMMKNISFKPVFTTVHVIGSVLQYFILCREGVLQKIFSLVFGTGLI